ncbi:hypothetical protein [Aureimonas sp. ME7]|uniref:hypothetical protein n=1 Tax=Aureimonas sp. ME7 TaxID=2744252 RepID=UPI0015F45C02|nr:hypothetical protein [Aureimonas sp. ME7]
MSGEPPASFKEECQTDGIRFVVISRLPTRLDTDVIQSDDIREAAIAAKQLRGTDAGVPTGRPDPDRKQDACFPDMKTNVRK